MAVVTSPTGEGVVPTFATLATGLTLTRTAQDVVEWAKLAADAYAKGQISLGEYQSLMTQMSHRSDEIRLAGGGGAGGGTPVGTTPVSNVMGDGGGAAAGGGGVVGGGGAPVSEVYSPFTAYMNRMGLGGRNYLNPAEQYRASFAQPTENLWRIQDLMAGAGTAMGVYPTEGFEAYLNTVLQPTALRSRAAQLLGTLFQATPEQRAANPEFNFSFEPPPGRPQSSERDIGYLQELVRTALGGRMAPIAIGYLQEGIPKLQNIWQQQVAAGQTSSPFLDWFRSRYQNVFR